MKIRFKIAKQTSLFVVVHELLYRSCWFEVEPLPDDEYWLTVKDEQESFVRETCENIPKGSLLDVSVISEQRWKEITNLSIEKDRQQDLFKLHGLDSEGRAPKFKVTVHNRAYGPPASTEVVFDKAIGR